MQVRQMFHATVVKHLCRPPSLISSGTSSLEADVDEFLWISFLIPIVAIVGGITLAIVKSVGWARVRELEVRERIAMIEKGMIPPPESNPRGFERAMDSMDRSKKRNWDDSPYDRYLYRRHVGAERHRRAGIIVTGVGLGLIAMLSFAAGQPGVGLGVGGFLVFLGLAFFMASYFERRDHGPWDRTWPGVPPAGTPPSLPHDANTELPRS